MRVGPYPPVCEATQAKRDGKPHGRPMTAGNLVPEMKQLREISHRKASTPPWIQHISPIEWDNVILYGQYVLDRALVR